jgi:NADH dehydrogenase [ubiquinone] 1 alpha subcomplex assembly factor 7
MSVAPTPLAARLAARIAREGPIGVDAWMAACLADPEHGYYRSGVPVGAGGDFTTAPEVSQIFGELLGAWAVAAWVALGRPSPVRLIELGPGRGTLMADALRATARPAADFHRALDLHLVEINPALRDLQRDAIGRPAAWHDDIDGVPAGPCIVLANEFLDALPVRQFLRDPDGWRERRVGLAEGRFVFMPGPVVQDPPLEPAHLAGAAPGDVAEVPEAAHGAVRRLATRLLRHGGAALFVDYGPQASGTGDTLQAVSRHRHADPLADPGAVDLTAHVDFAALARGARAAGLRAWGPVPQGIFLARLGLHARAAALARAASPAQRIAIDRGCARLAGEAGMGHLFKALALASPSFPDAPPGFEAADG